MSDVNKLLYETVLTCLDYISVAAFWLRIVRFDRPTKLLSQLLRSQLSTLNTVQVNTNH